MRYCDCRGLEGGRWRRVGRGRDVSFRSLREMGLKKLRQSVDRDKLFDKTLRYSQGNSSESVPAGKSETVKWTRGGMGNSATDQGVCVWKEIGNCAVLRNELPSATGANRYHERDWKLCL
jgi:hypothetical protein